MLEPKVSIQLRQVVMDFWKKCPLPSYESALNSTKGNLNRRPRRRDRTTLLAKIKRHLSFLTPLPKFKRPERKGKPRMISEGSKRKSSKRPWRLKRRPYESKGWSKHTRK